MKKLKLTDLASDETNMIKLNNILCLGSYDIEDNELTIILQDEDYYFQNKKILQMLSKNNIEFSLDIQTKYEQRMLTVKNVMSVMNYEFSNELLIH